jgi:hypothetical protein
MDGPKCGNRRSTAHPPALVLVVLYLLSGCAVIRPGPGVKAQHQGVLSRETLNYR